MVKYFQAMRMREMMTKRREERKATELLVIEYRGI